MLVRLASCETGSFLRGVLEKAGVEPQVRRFGKYKSAGDQLNRKDMAEPQREQLTALLEDIFGTFTKGVAASVGKTPEEVRSAKVEVFLCSKVHQKCSCPPTACTC